MNEAVLSFMLWFYYYTKGDERAAGYYGDMFEMITTDELPNEEVGQ